MWVSISGSQWEKTLFLGNQRDSMWIRHIFLYAGWPSFNSWHPKWSPEPHQECSLSAELGVSPKHNWVWPQNKQTKNHLCFQGLFSSFSVLLGRGSFTILDSACDHYWQWRSESSAHAQEHSTTRAAPGSNRGDWSWGLVDVSCMLQPFELAPKEPMLAQGSSSWKQSWLTSLEDSKWWQWLLTVYEKKSKAREKMRADRIKSSPGSRHPPPPSIFVVVNSLLCSLVWIPCYGPSWLTSLTGVSTTNWLWLWGWYGFFICSLIRFLHQWVMAIN